MTSGVRIEWQVRVQIAPFEGRVAYVLGDKADQQAAECLPLRTLEHSVETSPLLYGQRRALRIFAKTDAQVGGVSLGTVL